LLLGVGLFGMKGGHGAVDEMKDQGDEDEGNEEAAEKEFAGLGLVGFEEQVVHGDIDTSGEALVPDRWGVLNTEGTEKESVMCGGGGIGFGAEEGEEIDAAAGIEREGGAGEGRVDEIGVTGVVGGRVGAEIVKAHGHAGKKAALGGAAHEDENVGVAGVLGDGVGELGDGGFFALEALEEIAVFIEKHAGDAEDFVFGAGALEHDVDFGDVEVF